MDVFYDSYQSFRNVELLPHQKKVIKYLVSKCRKQHGLLVNHYQGTGKTITGIFFMKNYTNRKRVVLAPAALKSMWQSACREHDISDGMYFVSYEMLKEVIEEDDDDGYEKILKVISSSILVCDEAHNLTDTLDAMQLDASEIMMDVMEPGLSKEKRQGRIMMNEQTKRVRGKLTKLMDVFHSAKRVLLLTGTPITSELSSIRWFINIAAGRAVVPYQQKLFEKRYFYTNPPTVTYRKIKPLLQLFNLGDVQLKHISDYKRDISTVINTSLYVVTGNIVIDQTIRTVVTNSVMHTLDLFGRQFYDVLDRNAVDWGKYVSYYKYENLDYYPSHRIVTKPVTYTSYQHDLWYRLNKYEDEGEVTAAEMVQLSMFDNVEEAELFRPTSIPSDNRWRIVGNMGSEPKKFVGILDDYMAHNQSTLVYSSYYESGILMFSKFLTARGVEHVVFHPGLDSDEKGRILEDFKGKKIGLILLHPSFYEGFSIQGVRRFHILEPVTRYHIKEQLYTRVIRFQSHTHLPKDERHVEIIQWYCTLKQIQSKIQEMKLQYNNRQFDMSLLTFKGTVDDTIIGHVDDFENTLNGLSHVLKEISVDTNESLQNLNDHCCVYGDTCASHLPKCMDIKD